MDRNNKIIIVAFCFLLIFCSFILWVEFRSVKVISVHRDGNYSSVLVDRFPFTDKRKINWWLKNKNMLKEKYGIPEPDHYGDFTIMFWLFGEGYQEEGKYERLCFDDMKTKINCIDKDAVFSVSRRKYKGMVFTPYDGKYRYRMNKNGGLTKTGLWD